MARRGIMDLMIPWVDKTIAIVASLPFAVELYRRYAAYLREVRWRWFPVIA